MPLEKHIFVNLKIDADERYKYSVVRLIRIRQDAS